MPGYAKEANKIITEAAGNREDWTRHDEALLQLCAGADEEIERLQKEVTHWKAGYEDMKGLAKSAISDLPR